MKDEIHVPCFQCQRYEYVIYIFRHKINALTKKIIVVLFNKSAILFVCDNDAYLFQSPFPKSSCAAMTLYYYLPFYSANLKRRFNSSIISQSVWCCFYFRYCHCIKCIIFVVPKLFLQYIPVFKNVSSLDPCLNIAI